MLFTAFLSFVPEGGRDADFRKEPDTLEADYSQAPLRAKEIPGAAPVPPDRAVGIMKAPWPVAAERQFLRGVPPQTRQEPRKTRMTLPL